MSRPHLVIDIETVGRIADGNHFTTGGNRFFSDTLLKQLKSFGWI